MTDQASTCPQCAISLSTQAEGQRFCPGCRFPLVRIAGKYELLERLAEGGFGVVYLARHTALHEHSRRVIKVFKPEVFGQDDGGMHERFLREVRVTAALSEENQHIVRIYDDFGLEPGLGHYYVMEWLRGETLDALMRRQPHLSHAYIFEVMFQLCRAMRAAHHKGIIHRDLKPDNLFLVQREDLDPFVKVIDFGIAKTLKGTSQQHMTQGAIGTPSYMSPEQCLGQPVDARTDIYAMGIVLYEMLTGTPPFLAENAEQLLSVIHSHIAVPPPSMREVRPDLQLDAGLEQVVLQALAKESTERYPSVEAFWNALLPYAPEGHSLTRFEEPPLDEAFLQALEASQTIPVESMRGVPSDPDEALKWLHGSSPLPEQSIPSGDLFNASIASPVLVGSGSRVGASPRAFWHRIPIWMWFTLLALLCVGVLVGVWLPFQATDSRLVTKQLSRRIGQDMAWRTRGNHQHKLRKPTREPDGNRPDTGTKKPATALATRRQALAVVRRNQALPRTRLTHRKVPHRTRPRPRRRVLSSHQRAAMAKTRAAKASYKLAMQAFRRFRRASIFARNQRELRDSMRAKHQRYQQTIKQLQRTMQLQEPLWRFCAQVRVAQTTMLMADAIDRPDRLQQCIDCRPGPTFFYQYILRRFIRPLRRMSQRQLRQAQQGSSTAPAHHSCVRLLHRLQAKRDAARQNSPL